MKTTMDAAGRLVIPKKLREEAGLTPGVELDVRFHNGRIEIEPAEGRVRLEQRGRFLVAVFDDDLPPIDPEMVERTLQEIRDQRGLIE